jgi:hypothetical protein
VGGDYCGAVEVMGTLVGPFRRCEKFAFESTVR